MQYDDMESNIRITIKETHSFEISEEDYSLRIETQHQEKQPIHRNYAIEHHSKFDKHNYPHLQFKFHTEEIGTFWLRLSFQREEEYRKAILGFIYKIKDVINDLERFKKGICKQILVLELVNGLSEEGDFLSKKISESIQQNQVEFQTYGYERDKVKKLSENPLLIEFLGKENISNVAETYNKKKFQ